MPRYHFHIYNGHAHPDPIGAECSGVGEARQQAVRIAGEIIRGNGINFWYGSDLHMEVTDADGQAVLRLRFSLKELSGETL